AHGALALAHRARLAQHVRQRFARALAGHLHPTQLRETARHGLHAVARELLAELRQHGTAMDLAPHADEVADEDPPQVQQAPRSGPRSGSRRTSGPPAAPAPARSPRPPNTGRRWAARPCTAAAWPPPWA